jgi:uncharacterized protein
MTVPIAAPQHWYREPWPWLLMAGPLAVILAGIVTVYLAIVSNDGLVADDYYKRGLAINQTLSRDAEARKMNYRARVEFSGAFSRVQVTFADALPADELLVLRAAHAGRPALDRLVPLAAQGERRYGAAFLPLTPGHWQITLEDTGRRWRLTGEVAAPARAVADLAPR